MSQRRHVSLFQSERAELMKRGLTIAALLSLLVWKAIRTDWIVECESASADFHPPCSVDRFTASFTPPVSACWNPPSPAKIRGLASSSWNHPDFFAAGGSYGPTSEPILRVNWQLSLAKMAGVFGPFWICFRGKRTARRSSYLMSPIHAAHDGPQKTIF